MSKIYISNALLRHYTKFQKHFKRHWTSAYAIPGTILGMEFHGLLNRDVTLALLVIILGFFQL